MPERARSISKAVLTGGTHSHTVATTSTQHADALAISIVFSENFISGFIIHYKNCS